MAKGKNKPPKIKKKPKVIVRKKIPAYLRDGGKND